MRQTNLSELDLMSGKACEITDQLSVETNNKIYKTFALVLAVGAIASTALLSPGIMATRTGSAVMLHSRRINN